MNPKIPAIFATGLITFVLGGGAGILAQTYFGPWLSVSKSTSNDGGPPPGMGDGPPPGMGGGPPPGMGGAPPPGMGGGPPPGMAGGKGGMMGKGPSPRMQLLSLVNKLDQLTDKPLTVNLSAEQKTKIAEALKELTATDEVGEEVAKNRLDALVESLAEHRSTMEAAGFRWPGEKGGFGGFPKDDPGIFKQEKNAETLKRLQNRVK